MLRSPRQAYETARMQVNVMRESSRASAYDSVDWNTAMKQLCEYLGVDATIQSEPQLRDIEDHVDRAVRAIGTRPPWEPGFDADIGLARSLYVICRTLQPELVVETGVAYGCSSAFILKALDVNGRGRLESIDLPPLALNADSYIGALVPASLRSRWHFHRGSSQSELPRVIRGQTVDLFVHDSEHTYNNMRREFEMIWPRLRTGGIIVVDDANSNRAVYEFLQTKTIAFSAVVRETAKQGSMFAIATKG
jgi:predicted O-methyltransferase YrrM